MKNFAFLLEHCNLKKLFNFKIELIFSVWTRLEHNFGILVGHTSIEGRWSVLSSEKVTFFGKTQLWSKQGRNTLQFLYICNSNYYFNN